MGNSLYEKLSLKHITLPCEGNLGVEIEMETKHSVPNWGKIHEKWLLEDDYSLKNNGMELVIQEPILFKELSPTINELIDNMKEKNISIKKSIRAGVHIHLNMQNNSEEDLKKLMSCYFPIESILTNFCGDNRSGNLFCMRLRDAEYASILYRRWFSGSKPLNSLYTDDLRYSTFNLQPLWKYGTVEFRALGTPTNLKKILWWGKIVQKLYEKMGKVKDYKETTKFIESHGVEAYLLDVFGKQITNKLVYEGMVDDTVEDLKQCKFIFVDETEKPKKVKQPKTPKFYKPMTIEEYVNMINGMSNYQPSEPPIVEVGWT